jgi:HSP20 family protein
MPTILGDPFEVLLNLQRALDAYRESPWLDSGPSSTGPFPPLNVFKKGDDLVVLTELPGVKKSDLEIQVKNNTIRIAGTKSIDYPEKGSFHRRERTAGRFDRTISVPVQVDADKARAEFRDGILALFLPRAERDKPRSVQIN